MLTTGIVKYYLPEKGYGYIFLPATREEIYVHQKHSQQVLLAGQKVSFC